MPAYMVLVKKLMSECIWIDVEASDQDIADCKAVEAMEEGRYDIEDRYPSDEDRPWKVDKAFRCLDCGVCTERNGEYPLMVRDEL